MSQRTAIYGWTVIKAINTPRGFFVYKRDCPAAEDLAPFTHPTYEAAVEAGKAGNYAYKGLYDD